MSNIFQAFESAKLTYEWYFGIARGDFFGGYTFCQGGKTLHSERYDAKNPPHLKWIEAIWFEMLDPNKVSRGTRISDPDRIGKTYYDSQFNT